MHMYRQPFVGTPYVIHKPSLSFQTIGDSIPILSFSNGDLYPLIESFDFPNIKDKMVLLEAAREVNYFIQKNKSIGLTRISASKEIQCDHQKPKSECTCLQTTCPQNLVNCFNVKFPVLE